jgi:tetratricopeptide (TPR) repeat protein
MPKGYVDGQAFCGFMVHIYTNVVMAQHKVRQAVKMRKHYNLALYRVNFGVYCTIDIFYMKQASLTQQKKLSESFQLGQRAMQLGLFSEAERHFLDTLSINPNVIEAQASLAYVYAASKQHAKAAKWLKALLKNNPKHAQTHYNLANNLYAQQLYDEAIDHYLATLSIDPKFVEAHIHCGITYRMLKNYDAAISCLQHALDLDKTNARAFHLLGMIYVDIEDYNRALHCLECATGLAPDHAEFRVSFARTLEKASLDFEAGLQYHRACEIDPNYLYGFMSYGTYLLKNHYRDEALECFIRAEKLDPNNIEITHRIGQSYLGMGNTEAALEKLSIVLQTNSDSLPVLTDMGQAYQETGKIGEALEVAYRMIDVNNNQPNGYLVRARIKKSVLGDGLAENLLRVAKNEALDEQAKVITNFALGKVFDDHKNYAEAFKYYAIGNALINNRINYDEKVEETNFSNLIEFFNADFFASHQHLGAESKLPIVIVGMPRSGTTLTEQIISSHPNIIGAGEVAFWGGAPDSIPFRLNSKTPYPQCMLEMSVKQANDITKMYEAMLHKIAGPNTNPSYITDKMPHNFLHIGLIALLFPNIKIIHTKRDPIDTCLSIFFQNFGDGHPYAFDLGNLGFHYKQYERIMRHWHEVLPGRIMDINYEDTIADLEFWSRKLIDHIGLEWDDACLAPHKLERSVKTASHWQVRQPIYKTSVQRWKNYEEFLGPLIKALKD